MNKLFVILLAITLSGCGMFTKKSESFVERQVLVKPSEQMITNCSATKPPEKDTYLKLSANEKEAVLFEFSNSLLKDILTCNAQWQELRQWYSKQSEIFGPLDLKK